MCALTLASFSYPRILGCLYLLLALLAGWCLSKCCIPAIVASARLPPPRPHASQSGVSIPDMQMHTILMLIFVHSSSVCLIFLATLTRRSVSMCVSMFSQVVRHLFAMSRSAAS